MRVVIADTSPIRYLAQIGHLDLLRQLFQEISIPVEVARELRDPSAPVAVREWMKAPPVWMNIRETGDIEDPHLAGLDSGERSAIALGISLQADLILIDERKGAAAARRKGFETTGTLGILDLAASRGHIDIADAIDRLKRTNFRYRQDIIEAILARARQT